MKKRKIFKGDVIEHEQGTMELVDIWTYYNNEFDVFKLTPKDKSKPEYLLAYANTQGKPFHHKKIEGQVGLMQSFYTECILAWEHK